jgi:phosphinothricin acetyltransferase
MPIRLAELSDLAAIVAIYNSSIPGRAATADTAPVSVEERIVWFREFDPIRRPLLVHCGMESGEVTGWLSLRSFYGRPAYDATAETGVYTDPRSHRRGIARSLLSHAIATAPSLRLRTLLAFVFAHNAPSLALFRGAGFAEWGRLPGVAELDGVERDLTILGLRIAAPSPAGELIP